MRRLRREQPERTINSNEPIPEWELSVFRYFASIPGQFNVAREDGSVEQGWGAETIDQTPDGTWVIIINKPPLDLARPDELQKVEEKIPTPQQLLDWNPEPDQNS